MSAKVPALTARRAAGGGGITITVRLRGGGFYRDTVRVDGSTDLTSTEARVLAASLIVCADQVDAAVEKKAAGEARRKAWRDREVAAGRMKIMEVSDVFRR